MNPGSALPLLLFLLFTVGVVTLAVVLGRKQQQRTRILLGALAARLGLEFKSVPTRFGLGSPPTVEGARRGRAVRFFTYSTGSGKSRTRWCAVAAAAPGAGAFTLNLQSQNLVGRIAVALGMQDIRIGDPAFDEAFIIQSSDPACATAALLPEIRTRLLDERQKGAHGHLSVKNGEVRYAEIGSFDSEAQVNRLASMLELACDLAEVADVYAKA